MSLHPRCSVALSPHRFLSLARTPDVLPSFIYLPLALVPSFSRLPYYSRVGVTLCRSVRFRTILTFPCSSSAPTINYFSNPDVTYFGTPTGTPARDNARAIESYKVSRSRTKKLEACLALPRPSSKDTYRADVVAVGAILCSGCSLDMRESQIARSSTPVFASASVYENRGWSGFA